jgi:hypothetical protein
MNTDSGNSFWALDPFTRSCIETAIWSSRYKDTEDIENDLNVNCLKPEALNAIANDCKAFQENNRSALEACGLSPEHAGADFWMSRNGLGGGFRHSENTIALESLHRSSCNFGRAYLAMDDNGSLELIQTHDTPLSLDNYTVAYGIQNDTEAKMMAAAKDLCDALNALIIERNSIFICDTNDSFARGEISEIELHDIIDAGCQSKACILARKAIAKATLPPRFD